MLILARFAVVRTVLVRCHSRQSAMVKRFVAELPRKQCCGTTVGDSLSLCARNSAGFVDHPADDRKNAEVGYFLFRVSVVPCAFGSNAHKPHWSMRFQPLRCQRIAIAGSSESAAGTRARERGTSLPMDGPRMTSASSWNTRNGRELP
jgi:hypothetical protein